MLIRNASKLQPLIVSEITSYEQRVKKLADELAKKAVKKSYMKDHYHLHGGKAAFLGIFGGKDARLETWQTKEYLENDPIDFIALAKYEME